MKILVFSDSHGYKSAMSEAVSLESPNMIIHLGDHEKDIAFIENEFPNIPTRAVRGNCDRTLGAEIDEFVVAGRRFLTTHGHRFGVKTGLRSLIAEAVQRGADAVLYGHTHISHYEVRDNLAIINPGSIGAATKTYAVLELKNGAIECNHKTL
ncbi:MAG: metallophosphoesterase [Oscillospiraceae bacterium]|nr:metallophosphoesterase [Oscillospiraceae bacterium]